MNLDQMLEQLADEKRSAEEEVVKIQHAIHTLEQLKMFQEDRGITESLMRTSLVHRSIQSPTGTG